jgi:hypothetical protein
MAVRLEKAALHQQLFQSGTAQSALASRSFPYSNGRCPENATPAADPPPKLARKAAVCPLPPPMQGKMVTKLREMGFLTRAAEAWSADPLRSGWIEGFPSRIEGCGAKGGGHLMVRCVAKTCILVLGEIEVHATVPGWCSVCHLPSCREGGRKNRWADSK